MSSQGPLFVNQGFYIPSCLFSSIAFKNGSCLFVFSFSRSRSRVKGHGLRIYRTNDNITIFGRYSVNIWFKLGNIVSKYLTPILNAIFK